MAGASEGEGLYAHSIVDAFLIALIGQKSYNLIMRKISQLKTSSLLNIGEYTDEITRTCQENSIDLLYLFGSAVAGQIGPLSDIDLAFYSKNGNADLIENLQIEFVKIFKRDEIDLLDLKTAGPLVSFKAIKQGKSIFCHNDALRIRLEYLIISKYLSTQHLRREYHKGLARAITGGNFFAKN